MTQHCVWRLMSLFLSSLTSPVSQSSSIFPPCHPETETEPCVSPEMEPDPVAKCSQETEKQIAQVRAVSLLPALTLAKYHRSYLYCQEREHFSTNWEWPQHKQGENVVSRASVSRCHEVMTVLVLRYTSGLQSPVYFNDHKMISRHKPFWSSNIH